MNGLGFIYFPIASGTEIDTSGSDPRPNYDDASVKARIMEIYPAFTGSNYGIFSWATLSPLIVQAAKSLKAQMPPDAIRSQVHGFLGNWSYWHFPQANHEHRVMRSKLHTDSWNFALPKLSDFALSTTSSTLQTPTMTLSKQAPHSNLTVAHRLPVSTLIGKGGGTVIGAGTQTIPQKKSGSSQAHQENMLNPDLYPDLMAAEAPKSGIEKESLYIMGAVALAIVGGIIIFTAK